jgi:putative DNA primase/helicase
MTANLMALAAFEQEQRPPEFADESLALRFAARHADNLRFVDGWSKWFQWDGTRWKVDSTLHAFDRARAECREASAECGSPKIAVSVASAKTVAAVERLARADRRLAATVDQWDTDPWRLNTPGGTVDLKTGKLRPHDARDYITCITAVAPSGDCPLWHSFLKRITDSNVELIAFLKRYIGYSLTGSTREQALAFAYGTGANGKSTFLNTVANMLADYAIVATAETFTTSKTDRHPTELAMLRGRRFVIAQEAEQGRRWAENRIKALTGGDKIVARFMRQDFFEFPAEFKLFLVGNHKPSLRSVDEAVRRRFNLVPFTVTIPREERDPDLAEKLKTEWPGILAWALEGCLEWQREGLQPPEIVRKATDDYLANEDALGQWLGECCDVRDGFYTTVAELFASWSQWAQKAGEVVGSQKAFSQALAARGFEKKQQAGTNRAGFKGITVRTCQFHGGAEPAGPLSRV